MLRPRLFKWCGQIQDVHHHGSPDGVGSSWSYEPPCQVAHGSGSQLFGLVVGASMFRRLVLGSPNILQSLGVLDPTFKAPWLRASGVRPEALV